MRVFWCAMVLAALVASATTAEAESFRLHGTGTAARAVSGHQQEELSWGGAAYGAVEWGPNEIVGLQIEAGYIGLTEGDPPSDPSLAPLDGATGIQLGLGGRLRPFGDAERTVLSPSGLWLSAAGGLSLTGGLVRPQLDAFLGHDFWLADAALGLGPTVGYVHVFQADDEVRPSDANIVLFGVHGTFGFVEKPPVDPDRDKDGILNEQDRCPDVPEDRDDFEDSDGCPEEDNDKDGLLDPKDRCPNEPEDVDGFEDEDGCPDPDNDQDGVPDEIDECPLEPEDVDGFEDENGCPDPDNDQDGILDGNDLCPLEPETKNDYADEDGCPDEESVRVVGDRIELDDKIRFWTNSFVIRAISYPLLNKLARLLNAHPEYTHISIEGHADRRGDPELNQKLSEARANAVREFLIENGVDESRVSSKGFGSSRPIIDADTEYAWFLNRRVEFIVTREREVVLRSSSAPDAVAPAVGEKKGAEVPKSAPTTPPKEEKKLPVESEDVDQKENEADAPPPKTEKKGPPAKKPADDKRDAPESATPIRKEL